MTLTWADKRRFYILGSAALAGLILFGGIVIAVLYEAPSCMDGKQNQNETGIDCGGSCTYLCSAEVEPVRVSFARALTNQSGRTDVVAYVENRNALAETKNASYLAEIFDAQGRPLGSQSGVIDIPARAIVPVFIPGVGIGDAARAFLTITDSARWRLPRDQKEPLSIGRVVMVQGDRARVTASVENMSAKDEFDRTAIVVVFNADGEAVGATQTVLRVVSAFGKTEVVFSWSEPFPAGATRAEVRLVPRLP